MKKLQELSFVIEKLAPLLRIQEIMGSIDGHRLAIEAVFPLFSACFTVKRWDNTKKNRSRFFLSRGSAVV
jgi:hypothetical protein